MKNLFLNLLFILSVSVLTISCGGDTETPKPDPQSVTGYITANTTWTNDRFWILNQKVVVKSGVTLTIQKGTIIKGSAGTGSLASALVVERGAKLIAEGTADQPIIFTSVSDNIKLGEKWGTNLSATDNGLWGGLIILGRARGSFSGDVTQFNIEGIPASDQYGLYGGSDDADNSGVLKYISIRHGGAEIGEGNEINGLTLGCVGSGTVIQNVEVVANFDDGIELFGGAVNVTNALVWAVADDAIDIDQAYSGTISNVLVIQHATISQSGLEIDGREGTLERPFTLEKVTLRGNGSESRMAEYKSRAFGLTRFVYAHGWGVNSRIRISDLNTSQNYTNNNLRFQTWQIALPSGVSSVSSVMADAGNPASGFTTNAAFTAVTTPTTGADTSLFSWTFAKSKSAF